MPGLRTKNYRTINFLIAAVWLANGLFCKVLNLVPRHRQIVGAILGQHHAGFFTVTIGTAEIFMTAWILSGIKPRLNAVTQIIIIAIMNTVEFILVPGLLLWGRFNAFFAFLFILVIYYNEFILNKRSFQQA